MHIAASSIPEVLIIMTKRFNDQRGFFTESYNQRTFREHGIDCDFVQDNHSASVHRGTIRGLHFQLAPFEQAKLVRVISGAILDVAVDLRPGSLTFRRYVTVTLDAKSGRQVFVPAGFAHGFCTLEDNTEVIYKVSNCYAPTHDRGIYWLDRTLAIEWPIRPGEETISEKDDALPDLASALKELSQAALER